MKQPTETKYRWYMANKDGMVTLCADQADAEQEAKDSQELWPHMGPHRAVQLRESSGAWFTAADMATAAAQGFREGQAAELAAMRAGGEPVAEMVPYHTPSGKRVAVISRFQHLPIGTKLYTSPPAVAGEQTMADVIAACNGTEAFGLIMGLRAQVAMLEAVIDEQKASAKSQPTQAQAGAVPLTDEQIHAIYDEVARREPYSAAVTRRNVVRAIEAAHGIGIKGGQHDL